MIPIKITKENINRIEEYRVIYQIKGSENQNTILLSDSQWTKFYFNEKYNDKFILRTEAIDYNDKHSIAFEENELINGDFWYYS